MKRLILFLLFAVGLVRAQAPEGYYRHPAIHGDTIVFTTEGGLARAPQMGVCGPEGKWLIEGHGGDPDIAVDNPPPATFKGDDAQLKATVNYLLEEIKRKPVEPPKAPPYPNKAYRYP